jgi:archaellum biogenesis protein FlaJ (TadC family)
MTMTIKDRWKNFPEISDCTEYTVEVRKDLIWAFDLLQKAAIGSSNAMHSAVDEDRGEKEIDDELNLLSTSMAKEFTGDVKTKKVKLNKKKKFPKKKAKK